MIHAGLDLSLTSTGCALLVAGEPPKLGIVSSKPIGASLRERAARLEGAVAQIELFLESRDDTESFRVYVEAPLYSQSTGSQHDRSGMWWMVVNELLEMHHAVIEVSPTTVKAFATGKGNASKAQMMAATARNFPGVEFTSDDDSDALWLAMMSEYVENPDGGRVERTLFRDKAASAVPRR